MSNIWQALERIVCSGVFGHSDQLVFFYESGPRSGGWWHQHYIRKTLVSAIKQESHCPVNLPNTGTRKIPCENCSSILRMCSGDRKVIHEIPRIPYFSFMGLSNCFFHKLANVSDVSVHWNASFIESTRQ